MKCLTFKRLLLVSLAEHLLLVPFYHVFLVFFMAFFISSWNNLSVRNHSRGEEFESFSSLLNPIAQNRYIWAD
jgi:hypothetical protein